MQHKEFRFHPLIEGLKVNEDGTEIYLNNELIRQYHNSDGTMTVFINKSVTTMRLVCEAWHGLSENKEYVVKKIDEEKGKHYSNLQWSKRGQGINHKSSKNFCKPAQWTKKEFLEIKAKRMQGENILDFFERCKIKRQTYYIYNKKYGKKEN